MDFMKSILNINEMVSVRQFIEPAEILCSVATPAEADMLYILALENIFEGKVPEEKLKFRLRYTKPWEYFDCLVNKEFVDKGLLRDFTNEVIRLYDNNPFSLTQSNMRLSCPYHDGLNGIAVLYRKDGTKHELQNGVLKALRPVVANVQINYQEIISFEDMKQQFDDLNFGNVREKRKNLLDKYTYVSMIKDHPHFQDLNGQRGVFAKQDIPAGTVLGYYSGDAARAGDDMPPLLCSWPISTYKHKLTFYLTRRLIATYLEWTDGYSIGNSMKLVNTAIPSFTGRSPISKENMPSYGNTGCFFGHFETEDNSPFISLPFYMSLRDVKKDEELMTFYPL